MTNFNISVKEFFNYFEEFHKTFRIHDMFQRRMTTSVVLYYLRGISTQFYLMRSCQINLHRKSGVREAN